MTVYRIAAWDTHFENNRTRALKHMDWVPVPNQMDGDGYTELLDHADGAAHFGAWVALVEVASRCNPRGTLVRTIPQEGAVSPHPPAGHPGTLLRAHDFASLSRITRIRPEVFAEAIPRLIQIGWLTSEVVASSTDTAIRQEGAGRTSQSGRTVPDNDYGTERNGTVLGGSAAARDDKADDSALHPEKSPAAKSKRKTTPAPDAKPEHAEVRAYFREQWKARFGADYSWNHGKDDAHVKRILDHVNRDAKQARALIDAFLQDEDAWLRERGHTLGMLVSLFNRYLARQASPPADDNGFVHAPVTNDLLDELKLPRLEVNG